jgi:hypothetical protein
LAATLTTIAASKLMSRHTRLTHVRYVKAESMAMLTSLVAVQIFNYG